MNTITLLGIILLVYAALLIAYRIGVRDGKMTKAKRRIDHDCALDFCVEGDISKAGEVEVMMISDATKETLPPTTKAFGVGKS